MVATHLSSLASPDAASAVRRYRNLYEQMFERCPQAMWTVDPDTLAIGLVNEAAVQLYGYSREGFATMSLLDIRMADDHDRAIADVREGAGGERAATRHHRKKDGSIIAVDVRTSDFDVDGKTVRLALITEVTEREDAKQGLAKTEDQLRQSQKMDAIGRLAGGVAHDFNNVLTVIKSSACFLEEDLEPGSQAHSDATEIRRAAERGGAITRQLLTLSRHGVATPRSLDLDDVVQQFAPMLRRLVGERVQMIVHRATVAPIVADRGQIEQVIMNLAVNARDAMPDGGRITIEVAGVELDAEGAALRALVPGRYVALCVTDTGHGMDRETQRRIFDPFFTTKDVGKGTGLGLAIVHGIVAQARGAITVYSELGHGTTFRIYLPVSEAPVEAPVAPPPPAPATLPACTALVVDDQPDVRSVAVRVLQNAGCQVLEAATADEARRLCLSHDQTIDLVVLDVVLSDGRGDVLVDQLLALRPGLKAVLMSGYPAGALSADGGTPPDLLTKPFTPSELRAAAARVLTAPAPAEAAVTATTSVRRVRVLLADDDTGFRTTVERGLRKAGFEITAVGDGKAALAALATGHFDAIVSDIQMPSLTGVELLREVRRVDLDVPVLLMSGTPDVETASSAVEYGAFRYLTKPFEMAKLTDLVRQAARAHALARIRREAQLVTGSAAGAADRAGLEVRFDQALAGLWLAFQPIVTVSGVPYGVEALMRSHEPTMPHPGVILDAATQLGRLPALGRRVRALAAAGAGTGSLFVNLHPEDLLDAELLDPSAPLTQLASRVVLEVTERAALTSSPELTARIARLRELGFRLAIDDIGAGYSGLTSFTELVPEIVKLDMSLVRDVHKSALKQRTIAALCALCHEVGTTVVGEGVETIDEMDCLAVLGCDLLQGYLIGKPAART